MAAPGFPLALLFSLPVFFISMTCPCLFCHECNPSMRVSFTASQCPSANSRIHTVSSSKQQEVTLAQLFRSGNGGLDERPWCLEGSMWGAHPAAWRSCRGGEALRLSLSSAFISHHVAARLHVPLNRGRFTDSPPNEGTDSLLCCSANEPPSPWGRW